ncbi:hypothetical protein [Lentzea sp. NBRC 102530]|uniref:hypothetical protein n=1 Tax=Lentzea sp. NBRC 102530 TaxID=3032201 RepID=UPI0024A3C2C0|nr:hypothetical protein [Lentzea sp. NBRC 102530]GLY55362.1 hypothetical protein Lesp01_90170 [Lentzea sp. NBRC 102530]
MTEKFLNYGIHAETRPDGELFINAPAATLGRLPALELVDWLVEHVDVPPPVSYIKEQEAWGTPPIGHEPPALKKGDRVQVVGGEHFVGQLGTVHPAPGVNPYFSATEVFVMIDGKDSPWSFKVEHLASLDPTAQILHTNLDELTQLGQQQNPGGDLPPSTQDVADADGMNDDDYRSGEVTPLENDAKQEPTHLVPPPVKGPGSGADNWRQFAANATDSPLSTWANLKAADIQATLREQGVLQ